MNQIRERKKETKNKIKRIDFGERKKNYDSKRIHLTNPMIRIK